MHYALVRMLSDLLRKLFQHRVRVFGRSTKNDVDPAARPGRVLHHRCTKTQRVFTLTLSRMLKHTYVHTTTMMQEVNRHTQGDTPTHAHMHTLTKIQTHKRTLAPYPNHTPTGSLLLRIMRRKRQNKQKTQRRRTTRVRLSIAGQSVTKRDDD